MARIAYLLLCHKDPEGIIAQAARLTAAGDFMVIHFDGRADRAAYERIRTALKDNPDVAFTPRRIKCGWGEWSLVAATLELARTGLARFPEATHFYLLSGDCMAIKSAEYIHRALDAEACDYIESHDFFASDWIKTGMKEDRLIYRHLFNERTHKWLFYRTLELQQRLGLRRAIPADLEVRIGSQWWCLRRATLQGVLDFLELRPDVRRFFRTTWIPDETVFQTLVPHLVPRAEIRARTLTFLLFSDYGMPANFYNDHYDLLLAQDFLFARKISPDATELRARLGALYAAEGVKFTISNEGQALYKFLTGHGRTGRRFAPRFWEAEGSLGPGRELMVVICKKWHLGKRLAQRVREATNLATVDYLFDEEAAPLPDLGGIQSSMAKRQRHRRALLRMLFDHFGTDRLLICLDPSNFELLQDVCADRAVTRLLYLDCEFSDAFLSGHAHRVGLAGQTTGEGALTRLLPSLRYDIRFEGERIMEAGFPGLHRLREAGSAEEAALALAGFLDTAPGQAREILSQPGLFTD